VKKQSVSTIVYYIEKVVRRGIKNGDRRKRIVQKLEIDATELLYAARVDLFLLIGSRNK